MGKHDATFYHGYRIEPCRSVAGRLHFHFGIPDRHLRLTHTMSCFGYTPLGLAWPVTIEEAKLAVDVRMDLAARRVG